MNQREEQANIKIKHILDCTLFNPDIADSMKYFQETTYRFHFLLAFMYEAFKEKEDAVTELNEKYQKSVIENRNLNNKMSLLEEKISLLTKLSENYENNSSTIST